ncbi:unnamed protein product [Albugo candida]|nr:unnamed protein product [Albugo candida]|eukprot:CCI45176.1 unnamed protein product [Albugo candida]
MIQDQLFELQDAFKAREMELGFLREHCESLERTIEQQDRIIAKLYATDWSLAESIVNHCNSELDESTNRSLRVDREVRMSTGLSVERVGIFEKEKKEGQVGRHERGIFRQPVKMRKKDANKSVLENHLEAMGFQCDQIKHVISDCLVTQCKSSKERNDVSMLNKALDYLLVQKNNFPIKLADCDTGAIKILSTKRDILCTTNVTPNQHEVALSAAFLRRSERALSARPSVHDFGLLESDSDGLISTTSNNEDEKNSNQADGSTELDMVLTSRSRSGSSLFRNMDTTLRREQEEGQAEKMKALELGYVDFMHRLRQSDSRDLYFALRLFVESILGPKGDGSPPSHNDSVIYTFRGTQNLQARCNQFFQGMEERLGRHPVWREASETALTGARNWMEKFVMDNVFHFAMFKQDECKIWEEEDRRLTRRMKILQFITPEMLDIKECMRNEIVWSMAQDELRRINGVRSPGDKIGCIERCCCVIFSVLSLSRGASDSRPGADEFLPLLIYIVLRSQIPRLYSNCEYITAYRNPADLMTKSGYCLVNLRSALEFLIALDATMLSVSGEEFARLYQQAERAVDAL